MRSFWTFFVAVLLSVASQGVSALSPALTQVQEQILHDRLFQTNLRGPRWTGNDNQNTLTSLVSTSMSLAGLDVETLNYTFARWDPRWWSLTVNLKNGTALGLPTTGYRPFSGNSGLSGVTAALRDAGTYGIKEGLDPDGDLNTLDLSDFGGEPSIMFFDDPSPTRNYSLPGYKLLGTSRDIGAAEIPELGNLTNPHWQSVKTLDWDELKNRSIVGAIAGWVNTSDENGALQWLPNDGPPNGAVFDVPSLYVGQSTLSLIRELVRNDEADNATIVLDAPTYNATSQTVIGHLKGTGQGNDSLLLYTHSDGPSIIEENGPILLLTIAEFFARNRPSINLDFVVTTGHISGGVLDEVAWMDERPEIAERAKVAIVCEHFGAIEWKDDFSTGEPVYQATGNFEPMWTMANDTTSKGDQLHQLYLDAFDGTSDSLRMAMISPQKVGKTTARWYGVGGSSTLGRSQLPTIGIIPQPDYLWAAMPDGGWSKLDVPTVIEQINVILKLVSGLDEKFQQGQLA